jgi:hypothetical protein
VVAGVTAAIREEMSLAFELLILSMSTSERSCYRIKLPNNLRVLSVARDGETY